MAPSAMGTTETTPAPWLSSARRAAGLVAIVAGGIGWTAWLGWRLLHLGPHLVQLAFFAAELVGALAALAVAVGLWCADAPRRVFDDDGRDSHRFAYAVADVVGRTRSTDLHRDVRVAARTAAERRRLSGRRVHRADLAIAAVMSDGPRRIVLVAAASLALLLGISPMPAPPAWAIVAALVAMAASSVAHVALGGGRIRFGDRTRWSHAAIGEVLSASDVDGLAPRRWIGTVAAVVGINVAIALRGMSDRWTHGLDPMADGDRRVALVIAILLVVGALYTLRTITAPEIADAHLVARRLEERTARQSALGAAVCVGLVGLVAGILPGRVDPADDDPVRVEQVSERDAADVERTVDG